LRSCWGGDPKAVKATITDGRTGMMPPFGPTLGEQGVKDVAHYVMSLRPDARFAAQGARRADLQADLRRLPRRRRRGQSGARRAQSHRPRLAARLRRARQAKIHLLTAYVLSLSQPPK
jgi:hypothetical protein